MKNQSERFLVFVKTLKPPTLLDYNRIDYCCKQIIKSHTGLLNKYLIGFFNHIALDCTCCEPLKVWENIFKQISCSKCSIPALLYCCSNQFSIGKIVPILVQIFPGVKLKDEDKERMQILGKYPMKLGVREKHKTSAVSQVILKCAALRQLQLVTVHQWALSGPAGVLYGFNKQC